MSANATITATVLTISTVLTLCPVTPARASVAVSVAGWVSVETLLPAALGYSGALSRVFQSAGALACRGMGPLPLLAAEPRRRFDNAASAGPVPDGCGSAESRRSGWAKSGPGQTSGGTSDRG